MMENLWPLKDLSQCFFCHRPPQLSYKSNTYYIASNNVIQNKNVSDPTFTSYNSTTERLPTKKCKKNQHIRRLLLLIFYQGTRFPLSSTLLSYGHQWLPLLTISHRIQENLSHKLYIQSFSCVRPMSLQI